MKNEGLDKNTLVVFTSDNGPWTAYKDNGGSAGPLRAKRDNLGRWNESTNNILAARYNFTWNYKSIGSTMDLLKTFNGIAGVPIPEDRQLDSYDLGPRLLKITRLLGTTFFITEEMNYMLSDLVNIKPLYNSR